MQWLLSLGKDVLGKNVNDEVTTWAGIVNLAGLLGLVKLAPAATLADRASKTVISLVEGSRKYRAQLRGYRYDPMPPMFDEERESWSQTKNLVVLIVYVVICVAVIAAAKRFS
jgi:hypothetical protein